MTKYLSVERRFAADHTVAQLTWSPEFCPNGKGWRVFGEPKLIEVGIGSAMGIGISPRRPGGAGHPRAQRPRRAFAR